MSDPKTKTIQSNGYRPTNNWGYNPLTNWDEAPSTTQSQEGVGHHWIAVGIHLRSEKKELLRKFTAEKPR